MARKRYYIVLHFFGPPDNSGGGPAAVMGHRKTLRRAIELGTDRLLRNADPSPHDRIQIRRPGEHPTWLYRDVDGRVCMWRKHPRQKRDVWGYAS